ncbi:MAG TPA: response regulator [Nitrososphaeraceae archaeon]|jgi:DNA-binding response OmpR family regulator|nr:response regulator [Nitrososphaeraceae archaeon]
MPNSKDKNILIVDDDEDLTNLYETFLKYDGYKVDSFTDPTHALYSFRKDIYDLVLLDLKMPKMNGVELSQELQNIDPNLFYRFITAANKEYIENIQTNNPGIEKIVIYKPLWLNELRITIHSLFSNKEKQQRENKDNRLLMMLI